MNAFYHAKRMDKQKKERRYLSMYEKTPGS